MLHWDFIIMGKTREHWNWNWQGREGKHVRDFQSYCPLRQKCVPLCCMHAEQVVCAVDFITIGRKRSPWAIKAISI